MFKESTNYYSSSCTPLVFLIVLALDYTCTHVHDVYVCNTAVYLQDVDQLTGEDLNAAVNQMLYQGNDRGEMQARNPDRPSDTSNSSVVREERGAVRGMTRMTSPEKWEIKQLIAAGVLEKSDYPGQVFGIPYMYIHVRDEG